MSAPVRIEAEAWSDLRFATLARILGLGAADYALIRTARIWSWQAEHYTPESPTYVVDLDTIESALGAGGAAALVRARLADETPDGFRIRGARGRIEWLWQKRQAARAGGEATKRKHGNKPGPHGQPHGEPAAELMPSPLVPAPDLVPEDQSSLPHAIPHTPDPAPEPTTTVASAPSATDSASNARAAVPFDPSKPRAIGDLAEATWRRISDTALDLAAELQLPEPLPFPAITPSTNRRGFVELKDRIREEGELAPVACDRVVANLTAQARARRSIEWLAEKVFGDKAWINARNGVDPGARAATQRSPGAPTPARRPDRDPPPKINSAEEQAENARIASELLAKEFGIGARAPPARARPTDTDENKQPQPARTPA